MLYNWDVIAQLDILDTTELTTPATYNNYNYHSFSSTTVNAQRLTYFFLHANPTSTINKCNLLILTASHDKRVSKKNMANDLTFGTQLSFFCSNLLGHWAIWIVLFRC
jgi:hypothetical protein